MVNGPERGTRGSGRRIRRIAATQESNANVPPRYQEVRGAAHACTPKFYSTTASGATPGRTGVLFIRPEPCGSLTEISGVQDSGSTETPRRGLGDWLQAVPYSSIGTNTEPHHTVVT